MSGIRVGLGVLQNEGVSESRGTKTTTTNLDSTNFDRVGCNRSSGGGAREVKSERRCEEERRRKVSKRDLARPKFGRRGGRENGDIRTGLRNNKPSQLAPTYADQRLRTSPSG